MDKLIYLYYPEKSILIVVCYSITYGKQGPLNSEFVQCQLAVQLAKNRWRIDCTWLTTQAVAGCRIRRAR